MSSYGKACLQCTKAKVRCAYSNDQGPCERCGRLNKECQRASRVRVSKRAGRVDKHRALEERLDSLVELLKRSHEGTNAVSTVVTSQSQSQATEAGNRLHQSNEASPISEGATTTSYGTTSSNLTPATSLDSLDLAPETEDELQEVLHTYRQKMFPFFPAVVLGPEVTPQYMAAERPKVWLILRAVCSKKLARQLVLVDEVKQTIGDALMVRNERTFDMLCALVLYATWGGFFCIKATLMVPIHIAMGLANDLCLTKPAPQTSPAVMLNWTPRGCSKPPHTLLIKQRTMDERRVVLGLFVVSSICSNFFQRPDPLRWTPYLDECVKLLAETQEYPTDELLAYLVRAQIIANGIQADGWNDFYPISGAPQRLPSSQYMLYHRMQVDDLKRTIPAYLLTNDVLRLHLLGIEIAIHEQKLLPSPITSNIDRIQLIEGLSACFTAVKAYFQSVFDPDTFPLSTHLYMSIGLITEIGHCLVTLFRISTFESPDIPWDRQRVVTELDLGDMVRKWISIFDASPAACGIDTRGVEGSESQCDTGKKAMLATILKWWDTKMRPSIMNIPDASEDVAQQQTSVGELDATLPTAPLTDMDFSFDDEGWIRDILNSGFDFQSFSLFG